MKFVFLLMVIIVAPPSVYSQRVLQVRWASTNTAPPIALTQQQREWLPAFRLALGSLPEETVIGLGLMQAQALGVSAIDAARLQSLFANCYARIRQSEAFRTGPSALSYCFSDSKQTNGLATVYLPAKVTPATRTIIFLHGYGGSLLAYVHYMAGAFPNDVIICPAYGLAPATIPLGYVMEALNTVAQSTTLNSKPALIGLSAGGVGLCRVYASAPNAFEQLICLGSVPPGDATARFTQSMSPLFIAGSREPHVTNGSFERQMRELKGRVPKLQWQVIPESDHYFLLSHEAETTKALANGLKR